MFAILGRAGSDTGSAATLVYAVAILATAVGGAGGVISIELRAERSLSQSSQSEQTNCVTNQIGHCLLLAMGADPFAPRCSPLFLAGITVAAFHRRLHVAAAVANHVLLDMTANAITAPACREEPAG